MCRQRSIVSTAPFGRLPSNAAPYGVMWHLMSSMVTPAPTAMPTPCETNFRFIRLVSFWCPCSISTLSVLISALSSETSWSVYLRACMDTCAAVTVVMGCLSILPLYLAGWQLRQKEAFGHIPFVLIQVDLPVLQPCVVVCAATPESFPDVRIASFCRFVVLCVGVHVLVPTWPRCPKRPVRPVPA